MTKYRWKKAVNQGRQALKLAPLTWKLELKPEKYHDLDKAIKKYLKNVNYYWYFKNVAFYDEKTNLTYYLPRLLLTRKHLYVFKAKIIPLEGEFTLTNPVWSKGNKNISSPIVTQQFVINQVLELLQQKQFLATCVINLQLLKYAEQTSFQDITKYSNIHILNTQELTGSDIIKHIEKYDELSSDYLADETIFALHKIFTVHSNKKNHRIKKHWLYCLYHLI
ncbi:hypothetical protein SSYRP_v1c05780 [Spiroplasma syrphidicola EA-1]|uniref:Uncharacterized protein n=1 Tax=Spiroplasma syrphidicola EA-1 TaxID=1276229 RepID=R4U6F4_9MOLU|nr:hypothetical protein [Spiroplasma syrphidicola]AGM26168.1 hypothetical protein SSYRP_v1c05780 [Spiroplasma syrphidicola EA-1]